MKKMLRKLPFTNKLKLIKIILFTAFIFISIILLQSCKTNYSERETSTDNKKNESEINTMVKSWSTNSFEKIQPDTETNVFGSEYDIYMARGESESCQIIFNSETEQTGCSIEITGLDKNLNCEILREYYIETEENKYYPDPLAPAKAGFTLKENSNLTFLLRFSAGNETSAGVHTVKASLIANNGKELAVQTVNVHVWDFSLPEKSACSTAVGLYPEFIAKMHNIEGQALDDMYRKYYDLMLDYKVCAYYLPYDILDERADQYLNDPRVNTFVIPYSEDDDIIRAYHKKLSSNPEWFAKGVFYPLDEPTSVEMLDQLAEIAERIRLLYPDYQMVTPFFLDIDYDSDTDQIDFMTGITNVWCPKSYMFISSNIYTKVQLGKYPKFGDRMEQRKAQGDRLWWYVCWEPGDPYCNLFVDMDGIQHRLLFWQQKYCNVDGFLYWGANYWRDVSDPWESMMTVPFLSKTVFGDGSLLYNGNKAGIEGACGSLRLEAVRDGIEDFDLFVLAEELFGKEWVNEKIEQITTSIVIYTKNADEFSSVRKSIGESIEKYYIENK